MGILGCYIGDVIYCTNCMGTVLSESNENSLLMYGKVDDVEAGYIYPDNCGSEDLSITEVGCDMCGRLLVEVGSWERFPEVKDDTYTLTTEDARIVAHILHEYTAVILPYIHTSTSALELLGVDLSVFKGHMKMHQYREDAIRIMDILPSTDKENDN